VVKACSEIFEKSQGGPDEQDTLKRHKRATNRYQAANTENRRVNSKFQILFDKSTSTRAALHENGRTYVIEVSGQYHR
jgi:hypothetical protein